MKAETDNDIIIHFSFTFQGPIGLDGPKGDPVSGLHFFTLSMSTLFVKLIQYINYLCVDVCAGPVRRQGPEGRARQPRLRRLLRR